jgi:uncharacterized membrane protein
MQISRFSLYRGIIGGVLLIAVAIAIITNTAIIALAAVAVAIVLAVILEHRNREIVRDERISQISRKAASASFYSTLILGAAASLGIALFQSQLPENVVFAGTIMGYFICLALVLLMCFYLYFSRKL